MQSLHTHCVFPDDVLPASTGRWVFLRDLQALLIWPFLPQWWQMASLKPHALNTPTRDIVANFLAHFSGTVLRA